MLCSCWRLWASSSRDAVEFPFVSLPPSPKLWERLACCKTSHYKALLCSQMTTLEAVDSPESVAAVAYLLNLVLKR